MKIAVLNGSPKGDSSVTIHSVKYLQKKFPEHDFEIVHVAKRIKGLERKRKSFDDAIAGIAAADAVLWAFPLYILMVPAALKRFVELVYERDVQAVFADKYTAAISTSIHFYDHIAHRYMHGICDDLDMKFVASFSADMMDLIDEGERERLLQFGDYFLSTIQDQQPTAKRYHSLIRQDFTYLPQKGSPPIDAGNNKVLVVTDGQAEESNVQRMVAKFCESFTAPVEVVNLRDLKILSSCIGCLQCGYDNDCIFGDRDVFLDFYRDKVLEADVLIFAGTMTDRYLSSLWKSYFDRSFFMGHYPSLTGKQMGLIISGPLDANANLREHFEGYAAWQQVNLVGFVTDEIANSKELDTQLQELARQVILFADNGYIQPQTFLGVGAHKLFRDEVWGRLRTVFQADHRGYKSSGGYDFPMRDVPTHMMAHVGSAGMKVPKVRKLFQEMMKDGVSFRHRKIVEKA